MRSALARDAIALLRCVQRSEPRVKRAAPMAVAGREGRATLSLTSVRDFEAAREVDVDGDRSSRAIERRDEGRSVLDRFTTRSAKVEAAGLLIQDAEVGDVP